MIKRHKTKWAVKVSLKSDVVVYFDYEENARAYAFEHGFAVYPPIYS